MTKINITKGIFILACLLGGTTMKAQFTQTSKIVSDDRQARDEFGTSVDIKGDYAVVGASRVSEASGAAYIYQKDSGGDWSIMQSLTADDPNFGAEYGGAIKISEDFLVVAAGRADVNSIIRAGALYVYENDGADNWDFTQKIAASDYSGDAKLGMNPTTLDLEGNLIICGAPGDNGWTGSFYIFENESGTWTETQKILAPSPTSGEAFGISVSISGDFIVVGSNDSNGSIGSAHIYKKEANGVWNHVQEILASDGAPQDYFGTSVSIDGDYLVVGAYGDDSVSGSAYVFQKDASDVWSEVQKITATTPVIEAHFGFNCEIKGDLIVVGAPHYYATTLGQAHVFKRDASGVWNENEQVQSSDIAIEDHYGWSVAMDTNQIIVGATFEDHDESGDNELLNPGSAYIFYDPTILGGISDYSLNDTFTVYPVPAKDYITIATTSGSISKIKLINQLGMVIKEETITAAREYNLDVSSIVQGVYFVNVITQDGNKSTKKIIKIN